MSLLKYRRVPNPVPYKACLLRIPQASCLAPACSALLVQKQLLTQLPAATACTGSAHQAQAAAAAKHLNPLSDHLWLKV